MAAHRYWALSLSARPGSGNGVSLAEVQMRGIPGGPDLCTGGTASGISSFGLVAANAFDDNNTTIWHNAATGGDYVRLSYDFGSAVDIVEMLVRNAPAGGTTGLPGSQFGPAHARVQWSDNGSIWRTGSPSPVLASLLDAEEMIISGVSDALASAALDVPLGLQCFAPTWTSPISLLHGPIMPLRAFIGGDGRIVGTVSIKGTPNSPVRRRVRLIREIDGICVAEQWSDAVTGAYAFAGFDRTITYTVLAYDGPRVFKATVADGVIPELIP